MPAGDFVRRVLRAVRGRAPSQSVLRIENVRLHDNQLLRGRNALVTGAGRNIGRSIALEMAQQGAQVFFTDLDPLAVSRLQGELEAAGAQARGFVSDASKPADIEALCAALDAAGVVIDVLANNVGTCGEGGGLRGLRIGDARFIFETNVFGPLALSQHVVQRLVDAKRPGSILFITSVHAQLTSGNLAYSASKAALAVIVRELALELAPHRIRVNGIAPGAVHVTPQDELQPIGVAPLHGSHIHPAYIGRAAVYLSAEYYSQFTTGSVLTVDAGMLARP